MTNQEFYNRTGVEVGADEFWTIHEVYVNSELDKDEFCKMWCRMNARRVKRWADERKHREMLEKRLDTLYKILEKLLKVTNSTYGFSQLSSFDVDDILKERDLDFLTSVGVETCKPLKYFDSLAYINGWEAYNNVKDAITLYTNKLTNKQ